MRFSSFVLILIALLSNRTARHAVVAIKEKSVGLDRGQEDEGFNYGNVRGTGGLVDALLNNAQHESSIKVNASADAMTFMLFKNGPTTNSAPVAHCSFHQRRTLTEIGEWTQMGNVIDGEHAFDHSGYSVSMSRNGKRIAIGARQNSAPGIVYSGHVRVYEWLDGSWEQLGDDIDGEGYRDFSGNCVSMSEDGSRVAIGSEESDSNGHVSGHVRVFRWNGAKWKQLGANIEGEVEMLLFGHSVSMSDNGDRVVIGARLFNRNSGRVQVFEWNKRSMSWEQMGANLYSEAYRDEFGIGLSMAGTGDRIAVGAKYNEGNGIAYSNGHVRVFQWTGSSWDQLGDDIDGEPLSWSGHAVAMSREGDRVAVGAFTYKGRDHFTNDGDIGQVRVYEWRESKWTKMGEDINGEDRGDEAGASVSMSSDGGRVVVGSPSRNNGIGQARVFEWSGASWRQLGPAIEGDATGDTFGGVNFGGIQFGASISGDGKRIAVAAENKDGAPGVNSGQVRIYRFASVGTEPTEIHIDIQPYRATNSVRQKLNKKKKMNVAILGSKERPVTDLDMDTIRFGPGGAIPLRYFRRVRDINSDGHKDLILRFLLADTGLRIGEQEACLSGMTKKGARVAGWDFIRVAEPEV